MKTKKKISKKNDKLSFDPQMMSFVNKMGKYYESFGISRIGGQIVGLMLITDSGITQEEIQRILGVSRSSISTNLKMLIHNSGIEEVRISGERKSYFRISDRAAELSIQKKLNSYDYLKEVVAEAIENLKKKGSSTEKLIGLLHWINLDKEVSQELLEKWKSILNSSAQAGRKQSK
ncbi:MAG TPA: hypothetical protein PK079_03355 [Leptospiraceae bacterium]|nr:hypothetical protein [Leptospiraceae bacterium]HMW03791.1 hypothetical protein [Leptospiraceae bacterium]HMX35000.1 hypothetical protein [Leptospiraceae bacterium]HMY29771.1 hypothetical protein [Leptospiraceae bacterium]HMZ62830.1 hypothetical protein [Leptospiraceae bacterium]